MTWGIRRIVFAVGAMLLVGGWGLTGYVDAYQYASGAAAGERWREGEQETTGTIRQSAPARTETPAVTVEGPEPTPQPRIEPRRATPRQTMELTRQVTPPSSWLYALGVLVMMTGAGLMALTVPWRGARISGAEAVPQQRYASPPPPKAPPVQQAAAPAFPGVPPLQEAQGMASAMPLPESSGKKGIKPLQYKKGA